MICDEEYPKRVAIQLLFKIAENFKDFLIRNKIELNNIEKDTDVKFDYLKNEIEGWQDPSKSDSITKLKNELNEVQEILKQSLNDLLKRGENLESLMIKSEDLSVTSVNYYKQAKKTNRCCNL